MLAQSDDGRGERLLGGDGVELGGGARDEGAGVVGGAELGERGVQADGLEVEQLDPVDVEHERVDVAGQTEVDDEVRRTPGGHDLGRHDRLGGRRAGDQHVAPGDGVGAGRRRA